MRHNTAAIISVVRMDAITVIITVVVAVAVAYIAFVLVLFVLT